MASQLPTKSGPLLPLDVNLQPLPPDLPNPQYSPKTASSTPSNNDENTDTASQEPLVLQDPSMVPNCKDIMARSVPGYIASAKATIAKELCAPNWILGYLERGDEDLAAVIDHATANPSSLPYCQWVLLQSQLREVRNELRKYKHLSPVSTGPNEEREEELIEQLAIIYAISKKVIPLNDSNIEQLEIIVTKLMDLSDDVFRNYGENKDLSRGDRQALIAAIIGIDHLHRVIALDEPRFQDHNLSSLVTHLFDSTMYTWSLLVTHVAPQPFEIVGDGAVKAVHDHTAWLRRAATSNIHIAPLGWVFENSEHGFFGRQADFTSTYRAPKRRYAIKSIDVPNVITTENQETTDAPPSPGLVPVTPGEIEGPEVLLSLSKAVVSTEEKKPQDCRRDDDKITHAVDVVSEIDGEYSEEKEIKEVMEKSEVPRTIAVVASAAAVAEVKQPAVKSAQFDMTVTDTAIILDIKQRPLVVGTIIPLDFGLFGTGIEQPAVRKKVLAPKNVPSPVRGALKKVAVPEQAANYMPAAAKRVSFAPQVAISVSAAYNKRPGPSKLASPAAAGKGPMRLATVEEHHDDEKNPKLMAELRDMADMALLGVFEGKAFDGYVAPKPTRVAYSGSIPLFGELCPPVWPDDDENMPQTKKGLKSLLLRLLKVGGQGVMRMVKAVKAALKAIRRAARKN